MAILLMDNKCFGPGTYYIGDLSHVLGEDYSQISKLTFDRTAYVLLDDNRMVGLARPAFNTYVYFDQHGTSYTTDHVIGVIKLDDIVNRLAKPLLGVFMTFQKPFEVKYNHGTIHIGDIRIDTDLHYNEFFDECDAAYTDQ